ncbi:hypothetical protein AAAK52_17515 [Clostridioides difficile]
MISIQSIIFIFLTFLNGIRVAIIHASTEIIVACKIEVIGILVKSSFSIVAMFIIIALAYPAIEPNIAAKIP